MDAETAKAEARAVAESAEYATELSGAPDGHDVVLAFNTTFEKAGRIHGCSDTALVHPSRRIAFGPSRRGYRWVPQTPA